MRRLRNLNWQTLLLELLVVFIGLFAALQLDEWREDAALRASETRYLERLRADLTRYREQLADMIPLLERNHQAVVHVHTSLVAGEIVGSKERLFEIGLIYVDMLPSHAPPRAAYDEMVASGMFARLGSEPLKRTISDLFTYQEISASNFAWWRQMAIDLADHLASRVEYYDAAPDGEDFNILPNEPERRVHYDWHSLDDRYIRNGFYWASDIHNDWLNAYRNLHSLTETTLAELDQGLASR